MPIDRVQENWWQRCKVGWTLMPWERQQYEYRAKKRPGPAGRFWWYYNGAVYVTEDGSLHSGDIKVLLDERANRNRLKLKRAYDLQKRLEREEAARAVEWNEKTLRARRARLEPVDRIAPASSPDTKSLIETAVKRFLDEVPALQQLKLVAGLELQNPGEPQLYRVELPGPKVTKDIAIDARVRLAVSSSYFEALATTGRVRDWREAFEKGDAKATGVEDVLRLIVKVVERQEGRARVPEGSRRVVEPNVPSQLRSRPVSIDEMLSRIDAVKQPEPDQDRTR